MYERSNYLAVGVFILLGAIALLAVGFWVGGVGKTVPMSQYAIVFERDVNGLSQGSPVRYMGVDVGQVSTIELSHAQERAIEVHIEVASSTPIDSGTYASLGYQGITGVAFINLAGEPGVQSRLATVAGHELPVIQTRDVGIAALLNSGPEVLAGINKVLQDTGSLLSEENLESTAQILQNLKDVTGAMAEQRQALAGLPARMNQSLDKLDNTLDQAAELTAEVKPELLAAAHNLRLSSDKLVGVTGQVEHWLVKNDAAIDNFLANGIGETTALVTDAREAIRELEKLGFELRDNPSRVVYKPRLEPVAVAE